MRLVGRGPVHTPVKKALGRWYKPLADLSVGDEVDVLLDDGRIVRTTVRIALLRQYHGDRRPQPQIWVTGITGSYASSRIRPVDGWWRTPGCSRIAVDAGVCGAEATGGGHIPDDARLVCGEPAGHTGPHRDEDWNAEWSEVPS